MNTIGVYIHIPYCIKKCPYCDFNSYGIGQNSAEEFAEAEYVRALLAELKYRVSKDSWGKREVCSIFFGGGTPSLFKPESIATILSALGESLRFTADIEITLECNPGTIGEELGLEKLRGFRDAGVNRISMGVQSFQQPKLQFLGRIHTAAGLDEAILNITRAGFSNFNLDLMFGVAGETLDEWAFDLNSALAFNPPHLSCYCLTIEPGTEFGRLKRKGRLPLLEDELQAEMFELTQQSLASRGFEQYEISNYARSGYSCRHNLGYWRGRDYLGLGAGAHNYTRVNQNAVEGNADGQERFWGKRWSNIPGPAEYLERATNQGDASQRSEMIDRNLAELEFFFLGLRCSEGIGRRAYEEQFGEPLHESYLRVMDELKSSGLIEFNSDRIFLSKKGFLFSDTVFGRFAQAR